MKLNKKRDLNKSGIYCIRNMINNKVYIGKAKCIYSRMMQHNTLLNRKHKDENPHLINSYHKYGKENFEYIVLEYLDLNDNLLRDRELFWIKKFNSFDREKGYNIREDSSTGLIVSQETRNKMRESRYKALENPDIRKKCSHTFWRDNPDKLKEMAEKVSRLNIKFKIEQYDKVTKKLIHTWPSIIELMKKHPEYKKHNIYAVCSGEKPSMYGFIWKKVLVK
jgi:group I intron endonuclease